MTAVSDTAAQAARLATGNRSGDGDEDQGVTLSSAGSHDESHGMSNLLMLRTRMDNAH